MTREVGSCGINPLVDDPPRQAVYGLGTEAFSMVFSDVTFALAVCYLCPGRLVPHIIPISHAQPRG